MEPLPPRQNAPKDGYGPRGFPDCYYTSRTLDSTARYARFVKKLRTLEEEQRKGAVNTLKELKDKQNNDFFIRCDRRSIINNIARRVDLCLTSYQDDLKAKRQRLADLLASEEEANIRKFVEQAQAGAEAVWQDKKDRLAFLLAKRQKELEEKYRDVPISKCVHVHPCIVKRYSKEVMETQLYQMKEKQAKKMAERELDKMWYEMTMKESEALAARMELDAIERFRRDQECTKHCDQQIAMRKEQRKREQEQLKQESLMMKTMFEEQNRQEEAELRQREEKRLETMRERREMIKEHHETLEKQKAEDQLVNATWDSLAQMGISDEKAKEELRRQKERETVICNSKIAKMKRDKVVIDKEDSVLQEQEARRQQDMIDQNRCAYLKRTRKLSEEVHAGLKEQIKENAVTRELKARENDDQDEFMRQLAKQLDQLVAHKELTDAQARKLFQSNLLAQIDYNKLLKERLKAEELQQRVKCKEAENVYQNEIYEILSRLYFSEEVHPFLKRMHKGVTMPEKCPCSRPDYCAVPLLGPKGTPAGTSPATAPKIVPGAAPNTKTGVSPSK